MDQGVGSPVVVAAVAGHTVIVDRTAAAVVDSVAAVGHTAAAAEVDNHRTTTAKAGERNAAGAQEDSWHRKVWGCSLRCLPLLPCCSAGTAGRKGMGLGSAFRSRS